MKHYEKMLEEAEYILLEGETADEDTIDVLLELQRALIDEEFGLPDNYLEDAENLAAIKYEPLNGIQV